MFVRFSCGCIGIRTTNHSQAEFDQHGYGRVTREIVFQVCDDDGSGNISSHYRPLSDKRATPIPLCDEISLVRLLGNIIGDGYRYREIKRLLNVPPAGGAG